MRVGEIGRYDSREFFLSSLGFKLIPCLINSNMEPIIPGLQKNKGTLAVAFFKGQAASQLGVPAAAAANLIRMDYSAANEASQADCRISPLQGSCWTKTGACLNRDERPTRHLNLTAQLDSKTPLFIPKPRRKRFLVATGNFSAPGQVN